MFENLIKFLRKNYILVIVALILIIGAVLRLYRIEDYMTFLGDEGRDVVTVRAILHGHLTFLGPRASAADFFTGPVYYYMMAPFLLLANYNPVGPAIMIAILGIITIYLIFKFGSEWFGTRAAIIAAAIYSVAPVVIAYSRSSWNPNPMPFFSLIMLYLLWRIVQKPNIKWFLVLGVLFGIAFQLHYIETITGVIIATFILFGNIMLKKKDVLSRIIKQYIAIFIGAIIGLSPFLAFEIRHGFPNTQTVIKFMLHGDPTATDNVHATFFQIVPDVFTRLFGHLILYSSSRDVVTLANKNVDAMFVVLAAILGIGCALAILTVKNKFTKLLFGLWLFAGVVLFGLYHKPIYDYYFEFMFPLPFLLVGNLASFLWEKNKILKPVVVVVLILIIGFNLTGNPFRYTPNRQYNQTRTISEFILKQAGGKPFNFALLTLGNSDQGYRYIFDVEGHPPVDIQNPSIDPERKSVTNQLFVVCEDLNCQPLGASLWEVAGFGRAEIAGQWPVIVVRVYKLVHYKGK